MMMMKIVIDNGRQRRSRSPNQLSDFHANGHEMESARLPLDRGPVAGAGAQAMSTYLRQTYLNQKTNDTLMRADIETLSLCLLWRCLLPSVVAPCCPVCLLPVARSCLSWPESGTHWRTMRKGKRKSAGQVVKLIEMFRGMRHAAKGFSILYFCSISIFDFSIFGQWHAAIGRLSIKLAANCI